MPQEQPHSAKDDNSPASAPAEGGVGSVPPADDDAAMEYKPAVKYAGIGLAVLVLAGVEYATYNVGYDRGYGEAVASGTVQEKVNAAAVENLTHFMQFSVADDGKLIDTVKNRAKELEWIRDPAVRMEAEWSLAQALIDRGLVAEGAEMLSSLIPAAPKSELWARRATLAAAAFAKAGQEDAALAYYRLAAGIHADTGHPDEQVAVLSEMVELLAASSAPAEEVMATLDALQQDAATSGDAAKGLRATIFAFMGNLHRRCGDREASLRCFEQALADMPADKMPELVGAAVCYAMALLEKGESDRAEKLLRDSVSRLADNPAEVAFQVSAMRELARLEQERGLVEEALGLLYRAEGAAAGRIPADNPFWPCLYDQRGWLHFIKQNFETAYADFSAAMQRTTHADLLVQPTEGAGRCCLSLGKIEESVQLLSRAAGLRKRHMPADKAALGRVCCYLGQAHDMAGQTPDAVSAYEQALSLMPADAPDRRFAEMSLAYAYGQVGRWGDAVPLWESLLKAFAGDAAHRQEIRRQLALCRSHGAGGSAATEPEADGESEDAAAAPAGGPASRTTSRRPRRATSRRR